MTDYRGFDTATPPGSGTVDPAEYNLGTMFYVTSDDLHCTALHFYRAASTDLAVDLSLYALNLATGAGTALTGPTSMTDSTLGWVTLDLSGSPVTLQQQVLYQVTRHAPGPGSGQAGYPASSGFLSGADRVNGPLTVPGSSGRPSWILTGDWKGNGCYETGAPQRAFAGGGAGNYYWTDATITDGAGGGAGQNVRMNVSGDSRACSVRLAR